MRHLFATLMLILAVAAVSAKPSESERFNAWLEATWEETLVRTPILATQIGDPRYNDRVVNFTTAEWRADNRRFLERQLRELQGFDRKALVGQERVSFDILRLNLTQSLEAERFPNWMLPVNQYQSFPNFLAEMGSGTSIQPFRTVKDYEDWHKRLSGAPIILDGMINNMRIGLAKGVTQPKPVMEKVLPQLAALLTTDPEQSLFWGPMKNFPESVPVADRERLIAAFRTLIKEHVVPAYRRMHDFVRDEYIPRARTTTAWSALPNGKAWYAYHVRLNTTTTMSPDAIYALGETEVHRIWDEMNAVRREVKFDGNLPAFFRQLQDDPRFYYTRPEELLGGFRDLQVKINGLLPKLFDIAPKADYRVQEVEAFLAASSDGASYMPPAADGSRPGIFYVNTYNLKAQPIYGMETLSLHEASPGHHFQMSIALEVSSLPKFRRFATRYVAYSEGWALYAESIGKELGLFTDPYQWYGRLSDEQLRAMRLVVDTGLHHKGWTRQQAIDYMLAHSSMAESDAIAEVERYIVNPGQALGYKIGQLEISRLRREAESELGSKFDIKKFHRVVLTNGELPLSVLAVQVREWIRTEKAGSSTSGVEATRGSPNPKNASPRMTHDVWFWPTAALELLGSPSGSLSNFASDP
ncbi:MAG TPA: DUF885 domain-containing protein [Burkholderiaceae bacterium]|nr:DUF885 domain-containing protein [Burkholderiaceae bacterium]